MLAQLVRPLVRAQIQLLTQAQSAGGKLMVMVAQWLSYLGVQAQVTELSTTGTHIRVSLQVGRPELCTEEEWRSILQNLQTSQPQTPTATEITYPKMTPAQQNQVNRLLAHVIRVGNPQVTQEWETVQPQLYRLGLAEDMVLGIRAALKVPSDLEHLIDHLEPELSAFVLSKAIGLALLDQQITRDENDALKALYRVLEQKVT
ncbi:hypothetical protein GlitD10_0796 [Gloeomargarita lithophora Alchichica-D10]|uniref:Uncharacterized protein n=1 Tax=Gloeomargarita lithophora Alchichica-D10 TaxID=1188229 RepID=A0A1J0AB06_9CYAN|nr:hypothetical protein [Gloeomargarita lithophora]APB33110.1 hypothetical protein GlitD10_0796 [Gloeomargarita lithophora Alchichica-D10]